MNPCIANFITGLKRNIGESRAQLERYEDTIRETKRSIVSETIKLQQYEEALQTMEQLK